jgi:mRNA-degrading endonuclease RelE of RelBE toxin-antitoxin system
MKEYRIRFTPEAVQGISRLHPEHKKIIRNALDQLRQEPYTVDNDNRLVRVYYVGHRKDVYDQFRLLLDKLKP